MKILIIVSTLQHDREAITYGGMFARLTDSSVTLMHVAEKGDLKAGEEILDQARQLIAGNIEVETNLCEGKLVPRVLKENREGGYDLIVIAPKHAPGEKHYPLSTKSRVLLQRVPTSVLVVRHDHQRLEKILICTGGTQAADPVIEFGARIASQAGAKATLLHVANPIPSMYTGLDEIEETLPELLATETPIAKNLRHGAKILADQNVVDAELQLRHGEVAGEILREARIGDYDLIVTGSPQWNRPLARFFLGDVTGKVFELAPCPALMVKHSLQINEKE